MSTPQNLTSIEFDIVLLIQQQEEDLTSVDICLELDISIEEAEKNLNELIRRKILKLNNKYYESYNSF